MRTFLKIFLLISGIFFFFAGQSGAKDLKPPVVDSRQVCLICHSVDEPGIYHQWSESPMGRAGVDCTMRRLDYFENKLVRDLHKIGYPLKREDILALDEIEMRFDTKNRLKLLEKILLDHEFIHSRKDIDYFLKTEVIYDALRLLDQHDLPIAGRLIDELNRQKTWETREKALLASMAAKRDIRYEENKEYLLDLLPKYGSDLDRLYKGESFEAIIDVMNLLSYLADLFVFKGDEDILDALIMYTSRAHGYPAESLSHRFVEMLLLRPQVFISNLVLQDEQSVNAVIESLDFGIRNNQVRGKVKEALRNNLFITDEHNQRGIYLIVNKFHPFD